MLKPCICISHTVYVQSGWVIFSLKFSADKLEKCVLIRAQLLKQRWRFVQINAFRKFYRKSRPWSNRPKSDFSERKNHHVIQSDLSKEAACTQPLFSRKSSASRIIHLFQSWNYIVTSQMSWTWLFGTREVQRVMPIATQGCLKCSTEAA